jgi:ribosome-associated protein
MTTRKPARRAARPAAPADPDAVVPASPPSATAKVPSPPRAPAVTTRPPPQLKVVKEALADMKAVDARVLDVRGLTDISDYMVIASGTSDRHVRSIADNVVRMAKSAGVRPFGVEGAKDGEWVLVDLPDVMVHVMLPRVREFYGLEQLWEPAPKASAVAGAGAGGKPRRAAGSRKPARAGNAAAGQGKASGTAARKAPRTAQGGPRRRPPRAG